jgi:hypothetical protein
MAKPISWKLFPAVIPASWPDLDRQSHWKIKGQFVEVDIDCQRVDHSANLI